MEESQTLEQIMGWDVPEHPHIKYHYDVAQHTDAWLKLRKGVISASVMGKLLKKKTDKKNGEVSYSVPDTDTVRAYIYQLASERVAPDLIADNFQSVAMERGVRDEVDAFNLYCEKYEPLKSCGFITNTAYGLLIGYSPDGLTALHDDGLIECKSRAPKFQVETIALNEMDDEYMIQIQTGLLVTQRKWCDFISYCGGMPMFVKRIYPDAYVQGIIVQAAQQANTQINDIAEAYMHNVMKCSFHTTIQRIEDIQA